MVEVIVVSFQKLLTSEDLCCHLVIKHACSQVNFI